MTPHFLQPPCCWWGFFAPLCTAIRATRGEKLRGCRVYNHKPFACPCQVCARGRARGCVLIVCEGRQVKKTRSKKVWIPRWKRVDLNQTEKTWTTNKSFNFKIQQLSRNKSYKVNVLSRAVTINRLKRWDVSWSEALCLDCYCSLTLVLLLCFTLTLWHTGVFLFFYVSFLSILSFLYFVLIFVF